MKKTLTALLAEKDELTRMIISEDEGRLDEYLLEQWRGNELDLKDKIDGYGYVLENIKAEINKLKDLKKIHTDRLRNAITKYENEEARLRKRLWEHADGKALRGNEYNFHPYIGKASTINMELVEPEYMGYIIPELTHKEWETILSKLDKESDLYNKVRFKVNTVCNVSDLPENHPAILTEVRHDVRIT
jgi:hypothetical protein